MKALKIVIISLVFLLSGCEQFALWETPQKEASLSKDNAVVLSKARFWKTLHGGNYQDLSEVINELTLAYLNHPNDPQLAAYLGFAHAWKLTERQREKKIPPDITDEIVLSKKFFSDAVELNPNDARLKGFLGDMQLVSGKTFGNEREQVKAYFQLKRAISLWPEFNYFTAGYVMSTLEPNSKYYSEALEWQWETLNLCAETEVSRIDPDFSPYMKLQTDFGVKRVCWNSWIAPHNFEGFFLNMGDMLVKQGDWKTAVKIYKNASLSEGYEKWPYRKMLEERIKHAKENVMNFRMKKPDSPDKQILFDSGRGCVVCHQD